MVQLHYGQVRDAFIRISMQIGLHIYKSTSNNTEIRFNLFEILPAPLALPSICAVSSIANPFDISHL